MGVEPTKTPFTAGRLNRWTSATLIFLTGAHKRGGEKHKNTSPRLVNLSFYQAPQFATPVGGIFTDQPYSDDMNEMWEIEVLAQNFKLVFNRFETESNFDYFRVRDQNGNELWEHSGTLEPDSDGLLTSPDLTHPGGRVILRFTSDSNITRDGFELPCSHYDG